MTVRSLFFLRDFLIGPCQPLKMAVPAQLRMPSFRQPGDRSLRPRRDEFHQLSLRKDSEMQTLQYFTWLVVFNMACCYLLLALASLGVKAFDCRGRPMSWMKQCFQILLVLTDFNVCVWARVIAFLNFATSSAIKSLYVPCLALLGQIFSG